MEHVIVIAASEGALEPLRRIVASLPSDCAVATFIVWHIGTPPSILPRILSDAGECPASFGTHGELIQQGRVYVAPRDHHMLIKDGRICLDNGVKIYNCRPAADPLFMSAALAYQERAVGIVPSGGDGDGASGLKTIKEHGGTALVQLPSDAIKPSMPQSAIVADHPDSCLTARMIARRVAELASSTFA